jgi:hypothetical protein
LHTTTEAEDEMKGRFLLNVVVGKGSAVFELLSSKDQALLVRRNTLLVLNLRLDVVDGIGRLDLKGDGLASEGLDDCENWLEAVRVAARSM